MTTTAVPSLRDHLRVTLPRIAPVLLSPTAADRIATGAAAFPPAACMVECHLGAEGPRADFLIRILRSEAGALTAADRGTTAAAPKTWARLRDFGRRWAAPGSPLAAFAQSWLEFDLPRPHTGSALPAPSFFADVDPAVAGTVDPAAAAGAALAVLRQGSVAPAVLTTIATCVGELPAAARWLSLGVMSGRPGDAVRVCVADLRADEVPAYLDRIGWTGSAAQLRAIRRGLDGFTPLATLALDVGTSVRPRLGIEYNLEARRSLHDSAARWRPFLDRLVEDGLCARHKRDPLLACIGFDHERVDEESWPAGLRAASDRHGPNVLSVLVRKLVHIKVVFEPGRPVEAKAYLELTHDWLTFDPATGRARLTPSPDEPGA
ncbi:hypothetical protein [Amycolatopsis sp. NPDC004378]